MQHIVFNFFYFLRVLWGLKKFQIYKYILKSTSPFPVQVNIGFVLIKSKLNPCHSRTYLLLKTYLASLNKLRNNCYTQMENNFFINFTLSISESTWSFLYPRFTNHYTIINFFVFFLKRNSFLYQSYSFNFWINIILFVSTFH